MRDSSALRLTWHIQRTPFAGISATAKFPSQKRRIGTTPIIIDALNRSRYTFDMPRIPLAVATGFPHHVTQRGNYQQHIFEDKDGFISRMKGLFGQQLKDLSRGRFRKNQ